MIRTRTHAPAPGGLPLGLALLPPALALALAPAEAAAGKVCPETASVALIAGQNTTAGEVKVCNDASNLSVTYEPTGPWCVADTNLHAATGLDGIPRTPSGNPQPDRFAYGGPPEEEPCTVTFEIPLDGIGAEGVAAGETVVIAAQADLVDLFSDEEEGAWAAGTRFTERGNWATYFTYTVAETPSTACVCDDVEFADGTTGAQILATLCPGRSLIADAWFEENSTLTRVSIDTLSIGYLAESSQSPTPEDPYPYSCQLEVPTSGGGLEITEQEFDACRAHLRVSCGQTQP